MDSFARKSPTLSLPSFPFDSHNLFQINAIYLTLLCSLLIKEPVKVLYRFQVFPVFYYKVSHFYNTIYSALTPLKYKKRKVFTFVEIASGQIKKEKFYFFWFHGIENKRKKIIRKSVKKVILIFFSTQIVLYYLKQEFCKEMETFTFVGNVKDKVIRKNEKLIISTALSHSVTNYIYLCTGFMILFLILHLVPSFFHSMILPVAIHNIAKL